MSNLVETAKIQLNELINKAISTAIKDGKLPEGEIPQFVIEIPSDTAHGDFATNIAMVSARAFHLAPKKIAEIICEEFDLSNSFFEKTEIAGPGFINFFLQKNWFANVVSDIISEGENYGRSDFGNGEKVMIEFVSANPTGPMHMGNA
ncbi:MAG: arginine--tRNA ligase, partial [Oscillospiraceae bacterium]